MIPVSELDLVKIGEIVKAHGYKGELVIKLLITFENLKKTELLFFEIEGILVPFFFSCKPKKFKSASIIAKFNNLNSDVEVKELMKCSIFTTKENVIPEEVNIFDTLEGYEVYDNGVFLGKAGNYLNIPSNPILTVISGSNTEILIPINEDFLKEIDKKNQKIIFNLPPGLIDVNS
ncbi:MAG: hypothetical protein L3J35_13205 [Bacteroidales bacterium]|nr:hypothetical protein [Bacteroidales bacterium]